MTNNEIITRMKEFSGNEIKVLLAQNIGCKTLAEYIKTTGMCRNTVIKCMSKLDIRMTTESPPEVVTVQVVSDVSEKVSKNDTAYLKSSYIYKELRLELEQAFLSKTAWSNYAAERTNLKQFIKKCEGMHPEDPGELAKGLVNEFWKATESTDKFYSQIEFTPRKINSLFDNLLKRFKGTVEERVDNDEWAEKLAGVGE